MKLVRRVSGHDLFDDVHNNITRCEMEICNLNPRVFAVNVDRISQRI